MHDELTRRLQAAAEVRDVVRVVRVRVWETSSSWAEYVGA
jgi:hypothetical protein